MGTSTTDPQVVSATLQRNVPTKGTSGGELAHWSDVADGTYAGARLRNRKPAPTLLVAGAAVSPPLRSTEQVLILDQPGPTLSDVLERYRWVIGGVAWRIVGVTSYTHTMQFVVEKGT